ncbi:MAG: 2-deoxy-D-gluconate 3-dehydrogenase [Bacillus thermozeamaize]|uniref:2-deoxy-D-gluconate 3-dehydrogenase n=1 Tax=Bacillus thermozeamaize TaxID=230954 RepID=A0A1Y3PS26_9BACI|nr:MAG: 2-deoxy-D-gluconate 3-dehydrogenase [Bacillus thermozeamaize]
MKIPTFDLTGKVALITGGTKGIGFGMAMALAHYGADVAIVGRNRQDGETAVRKLQEKTNKVEFFATDVTDKQQVNDMVQKVVDAFGRIDILVNNAGMNIRKPLIEIEEEDWDRVLNTNLKGIFLVGQAVARQMIKQKGGRIINISSILGSIGLSHQTSYAASKGGINQLTKVWACELAPYQITVNAIGPAYIKTPMTAEWLSEPDRYQNIVNSTLLGRIGELEDLAGPVVFLASDASSYITGQVLYVDGGWLVR